MERLPPNRVGELRRIHSLTPAHLAVELDVSVTTIHRYEHGTVQIPDRHKLTLADLFAVDVPYLMGWANNGNCGDGKRKRRRRAA